MGSDKIFSSGSTYNIYYLITHSIRYQDGWTALHYAARHGHAKVTTLLLDREADINPTNIVSDVIWEIVVIVSVIDCVIKLCDGSIVVIFTRQRQH